MQDDLKVTSLERRRRRQFRQLIPNLVTVFVICAGLTSIRFAIDGRYGVAMLLIVLAAVLDAMDGRIARALDSVSDIGAELDSLADFFNFGIAPGIMIYYAIFAGTPHANLGWLAVLTLAVCCALRLARFNVALSEPEGAKPEWKKQYFVGVPAPAMGCTAMLPMFFVMLGNMFFRDHPYLTFVYLVVIGLLAASRIPTFSVKHIRFSHDMFLPILLVSAGSIALLVVFTWEAMIGGTVVYLLSVPAAALHFYLRDRKYREGGLEEADDVA
jgi:CDP-diacylglycerol--serine O-phosphatidyltransferase